MLRARDAVPNIALFNLRDAAGLTQDELARELNQMHLAMNGELGSLTGNTISRWESGRIERPAAVWRRLLAQQFSVSIEKLGFTRPRTLPSTRGTDSLDGLDLADANLLQDPRVEADQIRWRDTRHQMNARRFELGRVAMRLYEPSLRFGDTGLVAPSSWLPPQPIALAAIALTHHSETDPPTVTGTEPATAAVRPLHSAARRYQRYSHAMRDLDQPTLFANRIGYRLLDVEWDLSGTCACAG